MLKYQGDPPCYNCLVRAICFNAGIDSDDTYEVILSMPCDEANEWFSGGECMGDFIDAYMGMPEGLI